MAIATPTRLTHIQALRGLAAMLVLLSHLVTIEARTVASPVLPESLAFGMMGVDLFFVISGFIMVYITRVRERNGVSTSPPRFLLRRIVRIYPLYWVVTAALAAVWFVRPDLVFSSSPNEPQFLNTVFLTPSAWYPLLEVGWTLVFEMGFYIVFAALLFLPERNRPLGLIAWAVAVAAGLAIGLDAANAVTATLFNPLTFEFLAGALAAHLYLRFDSSRAAAMILCALGLIGLLVWLVPGPDPSILFTFGETTPRVIRFAAPAAALVLGAAWLDRHGPAALKPTVALGDWSYSLYLTHLLSLTLIAKIWQAAELSALPGILFVAVAIAFALIVSWLTYRLIEAPLIRLARAKLR